MLVWVWKGSKHASCVQVCVDEPMLTYGRYGNHYWQTDSVMVCIKIWKKLTGSVGTLKPKQFNLLGWRRR